MSRLRATRPAGGRVRRRGVAERVALGAAQHVTNAAGGPNHPGELVHNSPVYHAPIRRRSSFAPHCSLYCWSQILPALGYPEGRIRRVAGRYERCWRAKSPRSVYRDPSAAVPLSRWRGTTWRLP